MHGKVLVFIILRNPYVTHIGGYMEQDVLFLYTTAPPLYMDNECE